MHIEKVANALIPGARPSPSRVNLIVRGIGRLFAAWYGGLWVGGTIEFSDAGLRFSPNQLNKELHVDLGDVYIPLAEIQGVRHEHAWVTGIVAVQHTGGVFRFRCFDAEPLAFQMSEFVGSNRGNGA